MSYISNPGLRSARRTTRGLRNMVKEMEKDPNYKPPAVTKATKRDDTWDDLERDPDDDAIFGYTYDDYVRDNA